jgi:SPP1 gp7 family putative phage head morphogenesis protein
MEYRPERIARTEMLGVLNRGSILGYNQAGVERIEWVSTIDEYSRDTHAAMDGETVNIGERFNVGGELLLHAGDPAGSPGNIFNCRCTTMVKL